MVDQPPEPDPLDPSWVDALIARIFGEHDRNNELSAIATAMQGELYEVLYEWIKPSHPLQMFLWEQSDFEDVRPAVGFEVMAAVLEARAAQLREGAEAWRREHGGG